MKKIWIALIFMGLISCEEISDEQVKELNKNEIEENVQNEIQYSFTNEIEFAKYCADLFEEKSYDKLGNYTDGQILLSPYAFIEESTVRKVSLEELTSLKDEKLFWGLYDGTGDSILLTIPEYLDKYVLSFDIDNRNVETIRYDEIPKPHGSELHNVHKVYPESVYVEFYIPSTQTGGMDWKSLIFVVSEKNGEFILNAVIHNQWSV